MKTVTRVRTIKEDYRVFVAEDGTEFHSEEECKKYETSAAYAVSLRFSNCLHRVQKTSGATYFGLELIFGVCDDDTFYIYQPETEEDVKNFLQWVKLTTPNTLDFQPYTKEARPRVFERLQIDDSEEWENYRCFARPEEIKPGKSYIYQVGDCSNWGRILDVERASKALPFIIETMVNQFGN